MLSIYRLPNKIPNEKVVKILHRDYFILFKKVLLFVLLAAIPWIIFEFIISAFPGLIDNFAVSAVILLSASIYYLFIWLLFFFFFIDYYLDVSIITNKRIIDVKQNGFFSRTIAEQRLYRIQDVTSEVKGILPTIFKYGDVHVQTAAEAERFIFREVPNPEAIRNIIIKLSDIDKTEHRGEE